jgi:hypothetical protein
VGDEHLQLPRAGNLTTSEATAIMALMKHDKAHLKIIGYLIFNINGYPLKKLKY